MTWCPHKIFFFFFNYDFLSKIIQRTCIFLNILKKNENNISFFKNFTKVIYFSMVLY